MKVCNLHRRVLTAPMEDVGGLIDTLASNHDLLWPHTLWPAMKFDRQLSQGANGGHGPIHYFVEAYSAGRRIKLRFTGPRGFDGYHQYEAIEIEPGKTELVHSLRMNASGVAVFTWPLLFRPLHDALIEDSLSFAELHLGMVAQVRRWSPWVKALRWMISGGKDKVQKIT